MRACSMACLTTSTNDCVSLSQTLYECSYIMGSVFPATLVLQFRRGGLLMNQDGNHWLESFSFRVRNAKPHKRFVDNSSTQSIEWYDVYLALCQKTRLDRQQQSATFICHNIPWLLSIYHTITDVCRHSSLIIISGETSILIIARNSLYSEVCIK